jgi:hypothetical protein
LFFEALLGFMAEFPHPLRCPLFELWVIFVFPSAGCGFKGFNLTTPHEFLFAGFVRAGFERGAGF